MGQPFLRGRNGPMRARKGLLGGPVTIAAVKTHNNIYLVGMMGAGKTTIGKRLAQRLKMRFVDCDHEIEARAGVRIPVIFEIEGEAGFRKRETQTLEELTTESGLVLATGGGAILNPDNRALLARHGLVIYLHVEPEQLWLRTRHDKNRPLLQVADPRARIAELYTLRDPLYRSVADWVVEGGRFTALGLARQLERDIKQQCVA